MIVGVQEWSRLGRQSLPGVHGHVDPGGQRPDLESETRRGDGHDRLRGTPPLAAGLAHLACAGEDVESQAEVRTQIGRRAATEQVVGPGEQPKLRCAATKPPLWLARTRAPSTVARTKGRAATSMPANAQRASQYGS